MSTEKPLHRQGIGSAILDALYARTDERILRSDLRAQLPLGRSVADMRKSGSRGDGVSTGFRIALRRLEQAGFLRRDGEWVIPNVERLKDRAALLDSL